MIPPRPDTASSAEVLDPDLFLPDGRRKVTWRWWQALGIGLIAYFLQGILVAVVVDVFHVEIPEGAATGSALALTVAGDLLFLGLMVGWLQNSHRPWIGALGMPRKGRFLREVAIGAACGCGITFGVGIVASLILTVVQRALDRPDLGPPDQIAPGLSISGKAFAILLALVVAPLTEELFFRGLLFRSIRDRRGFWLGAIVSSAMFGLVHYVASPWQDAVVLQATMVLTGFGFCAVYELRKNIVAGVAAHVAFNVVGLYLILS